MRRNRVAYSAAIIVLLLVALAACAKASHSAKSTSTTTPAAITTTPAQQISCGEAYVTDYAGEPSLQALVNKSRLVVYGHMQVDSSRPYIDIQKLYTGSGARVGDRIYLCPQELGLAKHIGPTEAVAFLCDRDGDAWVPCDANLGVLVPAGGGYLDFRQVISNGHVLSLQDFEHAIQKH
jgi:hypothetical protein